MVGGDGNPARSGVSGSRGRDDFSDEDRCLLTLLRPQLQGILRHLLARRQLEQATAAAEALPGDHRGVILLDTGGGVAADGPSPEAMRTAGLTAREREIILAVARGLTNAQIARELGLSPRTVEKHLERLFHKLDVSSRTAALARLRVRPAGAPEHGPPRTVIAAYRSGSR